ncbi:hypothetical protein ABTX15_25975 [Micromonospora sp. NPDC094482]
MDVRIKIRQIRLGQLPDEPLEPLRRLGGPNRAIQLNDLVKI